MRSSPIERASKITPSSIFSDPFFNDYVLAILTSKCHQNHHQKVMTTLTPCRGERRVHQTNERSATLPFLPAAHQQQKSKQPTRKQRLFLVSARIWERECVWVLIRKEETEEIQGKSFFLYLQSTNQTRHKNILTSIVLPPFVCIL